jgi:hypothetical protein
MGMCLYYMSVGPIQPAAVHAITAQVERANRTRHWVLCEPIGFDPLGRDGRLGGSSKLNLLPTPEELAQAAPDTSDRNDVRFLIKQLCRWSKRYGITWSLSFEGMPLGEIVAGKCDEELWRKVLGFASLGEILGDLSNLGGRVGEDADRPPLRIWQEPE